MEKEGIQRGVWNSEADRTASNLPPHTAMGERCNWGRTEKQTCLKHSLQNVTNRQYYLQFTRPSGNHSKLSKVWLFSTNKLLMCKTAGQHWFSSLGNGESLFFFCWAILGLSLWGVTQFSKAVKVQAWTPGSLAMNPLRSNLGGQCCPGFSASLKTSVLPKAALQGEQEQGPRAQDRYSQENTILSPHFTP